MRICGFLKENNMSANDIFGFKLAVSNALQENFGDYKFVMAMHSHQNNPHIHVLINKKIFLQAKKFTLIKEKI